MAILDSTPLSGFFYNPKSDEEKARQALEQGIQVIKDVPDAEYVPVEFRGPDYAGDVYSPEAQAALMGQSAYENISLDPTTRAAQMSQIAALERLREGGGLNLADQANLQRIQNEELGKEKAQREAILANARARGVGGSGTELLALLGSNQAGTNRLSQRNLDIAGMAQDRALQAGNMAANLGGNVRSQDYQQEAQRAAAADAAAKFNASMISNTNQFNVGNQLRAGMQNQQTRQGTMNAAAAAGNQQQQINRLTMPQASFADRLAKAKAEQAARSGVSNYYTSKANQGKIQQGELWGGAGKLGMQALNAYGGASGNAGTSAMSATTPGKNTGAGGGAGNSWSPEPVQQETGGYDYNPDEEYNPYA